MRDGRGSIERMLLRFVSRMLLCLLVLTGCSASGTEPSTGGGLATVQESKLPAEARQTLELIDRGGPFPYAKDGSVFGNFERLLPAHQRGYHHE